MSSATAPLGGWFDLTQQKLPIENRIIDAAGRVCFTAPRHVFAAPSSAFAVVDAAVRFGLIAIFTYFSPEKK